MSEQRFECLDRMLTANAKWASDVEEKEPSYFKDQFKGQAPPSACTLLLHYSHGI